MTGLIRLFPVYSNYRFYCDTEPFKRTLHQLKKVKFNHCDSKQCMGSFIVCVNIYVYVIHSNVKDLGLILLIIRCHSTDYLNDILVFI